MTNKFSICGVIRVDSIVSDGNGTTHHRRIAPPFVLMYFPKRPFDFAISVGFLINFIGPVSLSDTLVVPMFHLDTFFWY